jgi:predicted kinase
MKESHSGRDFYDFDASKLYQAHKQCQQYTEDAMNEGWNVVVSNTFTTEKELKPYLDLAVKYGYSVTSMIVENRHGNASIHDVPEETMQKMRNRFSVKL